MWPQSRNLQPQELQISKSSARSWTRLILCEHYLEVEAGRMCTRTCVTNKKVCRLQQCERICKVCKKEKHIVVIEDDLHVLGYCVIGEPKKS